eukprot:Opistho-2@5735
MAAPQRLRRTALVARPSTAALSLTPTRARSSHATHASPIRHHAAHDALDARARKAAQGLVAGGSASGVAGGVAGSAANGRGKGTTVADAQVSGRLHGEQHECALNVLVGARARALLQSQTQPHSAHTTHHACAVCADSKNVPARPCALRQGLI